MMNASCFAARSINRAAVYCPILRSWPSGRLSDVKVRTSPNAPRPSSAAVLSAYFLGKPVSTRMFLPASVRIRNPQNPDQPSVGVNAKQAIVENGKSKRGAKRAIHCNHSIILPTLVESALP